MRIFVWISIAAISLLCISGCRESRANGDVKPIQYQHEHQIASEGPFLYCTYCGMIPAPEGMKCPVTGASHNFRKAETAKLVVCSLCGAAPSSEGTKCPVTGASHNFREY